MIFYKIPTGQVPNMHFLSYEHLKSGRAHVTRITNETIVYLIIKGQLELESGGIPYSLRPGDIHIFEKGEFQKPLEVTECEYYYFHLHDNFEAIHLSKEAIKEYYSECRNAFLRSNQYDDDWYCEQYDSLVIPKHFSITTSAYETQIRSCLKKAVLSRYTKKIEYYKLQSALRAMELLILLHRAASEAVTRKEPGFSNAMVVQMVQYLEQHTADRITGDMLEKIFGYSFDHMNRLFKQNIGQTIFAYLLHARINQAKNMLCMQNIPITQVAEKTGFCDIYYFSRVFKQQTGVSPTKYAHEMRRPIR